MSALSFLISDKWLKPLFFDLQKVLLRHCPQCLWYRYRLWDHQIFGAFTLGQWAVTLSLKNGCFQAHLLTVLKQGLPFSLKLFLDLNQQCGLFPIWQWTFAPKVCLLLAWFRIRSLLKVSKIMDPPSFHSALPQSIDQERSTYIDFAENQLYPSLISLSPLSSNHPSILQHTRVRSFILFYNKYSNLFKLRSLGFGFANDD